MLIEELKKLFKKYIYTHKAKNGFNLVIFDNKEQEVLKFMKSKGFTNLTFNEKGINWKNRPWVEYYIDLSEVK